MKNVERNFKQIGFVFWVVFVVNIILSISILAVIGCVVYAILKHFGIVG